MRSRLISHSPYTASFRSCGAVCFILYQRSNCATSCRRKSADRSMTLAPASSSAGVSAIATPCGVAKNTTSHPASDLAPGSVKARSTLPRRLGNIAATLLPASLREVIARSSACGCCASSRRSSMPVYPVPPTIPTLITGPPKSKSRLAAAFQSLKPRRASLRSTLRELLAPPRLVQSDLLSLDLARISRDEPRRAERRLQARIILDERARDAVAHRTGLAALAAAVHIHANVERGEVVRELERLAHHHPAGLAAEELVDGLAVDHEVALARLDEHARHGALAPARAVVVVADH